MKQANIGNEKGYTKLGTLNMQVLKMGWETKNECGESKKKKLKPKHEKSNRQTKTKT